MELRRSKLIDGKIGAPEADAGFEHQVIARKEANTKSWMVAQCLKLAAKRLTAPQLRDGFRVIARNGFSPTNLSEITVWLDGKTLVDGEHGFFRPLKTLKTAKTEHLDTVTPRESGSDCGDATVKIDSLKRIPLPSNQTSG